MKFPKLNLEKIMEELDVKWTAIELLLLFITYIVGKSFLQLFTSVYGLIVIAFGVAVVVSPEFNKFVQEKIMLLVNKFRGMHCHESDDEFELTSGVDTRATANF
jgi:uncharacterized membrane protein YczE